VGVRIEKSPDSEVGWWALNLGVAARVSNAVIVLQRGLCPKRLNLGPPATPYLPKVGNLVPVE